MSTVHERNGSDNDSSQEIRDPPKTISWFRSIFEPGLEDEILDQEYAGSGTSDDPYIVDYLPNDRQDAMNFSKQRKWVIAILQSFSALAVTFASSVYASGIEGVMKRFQVSNEVATLGLSLYVLGFAIGSLIWAPLSELYGRKSIYVVSYTGFVVFSVAAPLSPNITSLLVFRFLSSAFGSSVMTNTGGIVADMFSKTERGVATALYSATPFLGPAFGPIAGGFLNETQGWRWVLGLVAILAGVTWIPTTLSMSESYAPTILSRRAHALSKMTGKVYISRLDVEQPNRTLSQQLTASFTRPWILLFREPIVLLTSIYISVIYGTLYMFFGGFPIIFQVTRGWNQGIAGLPFVGVAIGVCIATVATAVDNHRYGRLCAVAKARGQVVEPEARLGPAMVGSVTLPVGLFLWAWTTYPWVHWIFPVIGAAVFSCGLVMVFVSLIGYLIDSYVIYAASVLAANSMLRSLFATAFPLFTHRMYESLGDQWASSVPAFLVLGCVPFPFLFDKYGPQIRLRCKYASQAAQLLENMRRRHVVVAGSELAGTAAEPKEVV